jgi:hypothetical protein
LITLLKTANLRARRFLFSIIVLSRFPGAIRMDATVIHRHFEYLALERWQPNAAEHPTFGQGAQRKTKPIQPSLSELRKQALKRRSPRFDPPGSGGRPARTGIERCSGGHTGRVIIRSLTGSSLVSQTNYQTKRRNSMNAIAILLTVVFTLLIGFISIQAVRTIKYAQSEEWKLQQRMRRYVRHEAE